VSGHETFYLELIKPSHYDDDGYVIQWWRAWIPSNSLSALHGLALDAAELRVLGADVDLQITPYDECNTILPIRAIIRRFRGNPMRGLVWWACKATSFLGHSTFSGIFAPRRASRDRRVLRERLYRDVAGTAARSACGARSRRDAGGRGGGRTARANSRRRLSRPAETDLQFHERSAPSRRPTDAVFAGKTYPALRLSATGDFSGSGAASRRRPMRVTTATWRSRRCPTTRKSIWRSTKSPMPRKGRWRVRAKSRKPRAATVKLAEVIE